MKGFGESDISISSDRPRGKRKSSHLAFNPCNRHVSFCNDSEMMMTRKLRGELSESSSRGV